MLDFHQEIALTLFGFLRFAIVKASMLRPLPIPALPGTFALMVAICATATALAADSGPITSPEYRLSVERPDAFRLTTRGLYVPAPGPRKEPATAQGLPDRPFAKLIDGAAREAALDPALVHAVIFVESGYNPAARSPKGAVGLMQVLPETASRYGVTDPGRSPEANLKAGTLYLSDLMRLFDSRIDLALAAYNAGEKAVLRYGQRIPPYRETQLYVPAVLAKYHEWREPPIPIPAPAPARIEYLPGTRLDPKSLLTTVESVGAVAPPVSSLH